jgi:hypothetical protein
LFATENKICEPLKHQERNPKGLNHKPVMVHQPTQNGRMSIDHTTTLNFFTKNSSKNSMNSPMSPINYRYPWPFCTFLVSIIPSCVTPFPSKFKPNPCSMWERGQRLSGAVGAASLSNPSQRGRTASAEALHTAAAARATSLVPVNVRSCACDGACGREKKHAATQTVVETWLSWRILGLEAGVA